MWLAYFHSPCSVKPSAIIKFWLHESTRIVSPFYPASSLWSQQQWQNEHCQAHSELWVPFPGVTLSPQPMEFSAWRAPSLSCQLLVLSALNLCIGQRQDSRVSEQIFNFILTASSQRFLHPWWSSGHKSTKVNFCCPASVTTKPFWLELFNTRQGNLSFFFFFYIIGLALDNYRSNKLIRETSSFSAK